MIEVGLAYGLGKPRTAEEGEGKAGGEGSQAVEGGAEGEGEGKDQELARVVRFANRVPLLYQQSACATFKAVLKTAWRNYGLSQSKGAPPQGPLTIFLHMASVWVPFTSEAKEAIAEYDEIAEEAKRALQECGRRMGIWMHKREHARNEFARRSTFFRYIEEVAEACGRIKGGKINTERLKKQLGEVAKKITGGQEVDALLNKEREKAEEALEHTVVLTEEGLSGEVPELLAGSEGVPAAAPKADPSRTPRLFPDLEGPQEGPPEVRPGKILKKKLKKKTARGGPPPKPGRRQPLLFEEMENHFVLRKKKKKKVVHGTT